MYFFVSESNDIEKIQFGITAECWTLVVVKLMTPSSQLHCHLVKQSHYYLWILKDFLLALS